MALFESGLVVLCLALCAPAASEPVIEPPPPDLLEFLGEFGDDSGGLIDPTRLPPPPASPATTSKNEDANASR